jgi:quercetin dioxygenase-like cupin family protein
MAEHVYLRTHDLTAEHLLIDLDAATNELRKQSSDGAGRGGVTLMRQSGLAIVLTYLHAGGTLQEHAAPGAVTVQVLGGHIRARFDDEVLELSAGELLAFDAGVRHAVEAVEDSTLLLTLADARSHE